MIIERKNGYINISDIIDNYLVSRKYMDYTEKEAKRLFKEEFNIKEEEDSFDVEHYESFEWFWDKEKGEENDR